MVNTLGEIFISADGGTTWTYLSKINLQITPSFYLNDFIFVNDQKIINNPRYESEVQHKL